MSYKVTGNVPEVHYDHDNPAFNYPEGEPSIKRYKKPHVVAPQGRTITVLTTRETVAKTVASVFKSIGFENIEIATETVE